MAFTPEDGTIVSGANSYVDVAYYDAYCEERGKVPGTFVSKQAQLVQATDYMEMCYARFYDGEMKGPSLDPAVEQSLSWPRVDAKLGEYPDQLKRACCEYALIASTGPLVVNPTVDGSGYSLVTTKTKVGPIEREKAIAGVRQLWRSYPTADGLMGPLLDRDLMAGNRVYR